MLFSHICSFLYSFFNSLDVWHDFKNTKKIYTYIFHQTTLSQQRPIIGLCLQTQQQRIAILFVTFDFEVLFQSVCDSVFVAIIINMNFCYFYLFVCCSFCVVHHCENKSFDYIFFGKMQIHRSKSHEKRQLISGE